MSRGLAVAACAVLVASMNPLAASPAEPERWNDDKLVAAYATLKGGPALEAAIRSPVPPSDPPEANFLEALAWFAAGTPKQPGSLSLAQADAFIDGQVAAYRQLLEAKVERNEINDYPRTRTWKVVQKLTLLRAEMAKPERGGVYPYRSWPRAVQGDDTWDRAHTLASPAEFDAKVCKGSQQRPVLVKFGNTNCTQCMLFEMIGSVKTFAGNEAHKNVDVYKVWWGYQPDASFAGRIHDPERLDGLVRGEGVRSSPTFAVYRAGLRLTCGSAFPDALGTDESLDACLAKPASDATPSSACSPAS